MVVTELSGVEGQLARWMEQLANFQYIIVHRAGKLHVNVDHRYGTLCVVLAI